MHNILLDYYFTLLEVLVILFLLGGVGVAILWEMRRRWRNREMALEQQLADDCAKHDSQHLQELHDHLQSAVAHEFVKGLDYISKKSTETQEGLGEEQSVLRGKLDLIVAKACELTQHAVNTVAVFASERDEPQKELLNMRRLVEHMLLELVPYAEGKGVTLRQNLDDVEPTAHDRDLTLLALRNVIHNAIRYSGSLVVRVVSPTSGGMV